MQKGEIEYGIRKALEHFDRWNDCTVAIEPLSPYYYEVLGVIEDAVKIGARVAAGLKIEFDDGGELIEGATEQALSADPNDARTPRLSVLPSPSPSPRGHMPEIAVLKGFDAELPHVKPVPPPD